MRILHSTDGTVLPIAFHVRICRLNGIINAVFIAQGQRSSVLCLQKDALSKSVRRHITSRHIATFKYSKKYLV